MANMTQTLRAPLPAEDGATLLRSYLDRLRDAGYRKQAVDQWTDGHNTVRHHYTAGVWEITIGANCYPPTTLRYSRDAHTYPSVDDLIGQTRKITDQPTKATR